MNSDPRSFLQKLGNWYENYGEHYLNLCGFTLIGICFLISAWRIVGRSAARADPSVITIRIAHWNLESGVREGLDAVAREYEKVCAARGKKVRIEQLAIPEQVYASWFITQLVGGTAPDLMSIGPGSNDERLARFFQPFSPYLDSANPYNAGTMLEGVPWRNTFVDGMQGAYRQELLDYYTIPFTILTTRLYYNKAMYKEMFGDRALPKTYEEFISLCADTVKWAKSHGKTGLLPIAGSRYNSPAIMNRLLGSQTQKLSLRNNRGLTLSNVPEENLLAYLRGEWDMNSPEVASGLNLMQSVIQYMHPGFIQLQREDAMFHFVQKHSLMIATGAWDRTSIEQESPFPVEAFRIPMPTPADQTYGKFTLGQYAEGAGPGAGGYALNRESPNVETAIDFYRYFTSLPGSELFSRYSGWIPATAGARISPALEVFRPDTEGYPAGSDLTNGAESRRQWENNFYLLARTPSDSGPFRRSMSVEMREACLEDMHLAARGRLRSISRMDTTLAAFLGISSDTRSSTSTPSEKLGELIESQNAQESTWYRYRREINDLRR
ncbi:MAG: ABC transporter substrate-binding protein [Candidatus Methylacidiphilales bacterium]